MSKLTPSEVEDIACLARLRLSDSEKVMYAEQLSVVFDFFEMLNDVDTESIEETSQVTGLQGITREDEVEEVGSLLKNKLIEAYPEKLGAYLKVKAVFSE